MPYLIVRAWAEIECQSPRCRNLQIIAPGTDAETEIADAPERWKEATWYDNTTGMSGYESEDDWDKCPKCGEHTGKRIG